MIYTGVVENRTDDPLKLGRCKVRIVGLHSPDKVELPTEDLPWAVVMQPVTSAGVSGIGVSPTGLVEGAVVAIIFNDEHKQHPIIIGSFAGIPEPFKDQTVKVFETSESKALSPTPNASTSTAKTEGTISEPQAEVKKPTSALTISEDCYTFIRQEEACSSKVEGKNKYCRYAEYSKMSENTKFYAYQDTVGVWTIGWGNTYLQDGSRVTKDTVLTKTEVESLMKYWADKYAAELVKALRAPVTQSMLDSMVSIMYNAGPSFKNSNIVSAVNTTDYTTAASLILVYKNNNGSLTDRRNREKNFFVKDGIPSKDMQTIEEVKTDNVLTPDDATQNPVVTLKPNEEETVKESLRKVEGFRDPNGIYPKILNEPDTHRLARHEQVDKTIVYTKESARAKGVISGGDGKWSQPKIPYNAKYPYNHVKVTESGHVQEFDDTPGNERIHTYHRSGTYSEIDTNGTRVNRIVGDDFEILERNGNVLIRGSLNVTIIGNQNIRVENNANIDVLGSVNMTVGGDYNLGVTGNINMNAGGNFMLQASGNASVDATRVDWNSGKGYSIPTGKGSATGLPEFPVLSTPSRTTELEAQYETPSDGDPTQYNNKLEEAGVTDKNETSVAEETSTSTEMKDTTETKKPEPIVTDCSMIPQTGPIDLQFQLSKNFKLKDLNGDRLSSDPVVTATKAEIACNLKALAENCLEPIKQRYPSMKITSGYRNFIPSGGSTKSDHLWGCAADIQISGYDKTQYYQAALEIVKFLPAWTQVILETRGSSVWIHVAYNSKRGLKMEKFTMVNDKRVSPSMNEIIPV